MTAYVTRSMRQKMASDFERERLTVALNRSRDRSMTEVPFEWQTKQTAKAVFFPTYGWVPKVAIRWRKADGLIVSWVDGREGDTFLIASEFVKSNPKSGEKT